jgi:hypothetical protein
VDDGKSCHACTVPAIIAYRVKPPNVGSVHWNSEPVTIRACAEHEKAARKAGTVLSSDTLGGAIVYRKLT